MLLMLFHYITIISLGKWVWPFIWSYLIPLALHLGMICAKIEIGPVLLEIKIFKCWQYNFPNFAIISSRKRVWSFIWTSLNPLQPRFVPCLVEIGLVVLKKKMKMWEGQTDDEQQLIRKAKNQLIHNDHMSTILTLCHICLKQQIRHVLQRNCMERECCQWIKTVNNGLWIWNFINLYKKQLYSD